MTKSLDRLKRLAERKKIKGVVSFDPYTIQAQYRYRLHPTNKFSIVDDIPLGFNAQAARATLKQMAEGQ